MKSVPHRGSVWLFAALPPPVRNASGFPEVSFFELEATPQQQSRKKLSLGESESQRHSARGAAKPRRSILDRVEPYATV